MLHCEEEITTRSSKIDGSHQWKSLFFFPLSTTEICGCGEPYPQPHYQRASISFIIRALMCLRCFFSFLCHLFFFLLPCFFLIISFMLLNIYKKACWLLHGWIIWENKNLELKFISCAMCTTPNCAYTASAYQLQY